MKYSLYIGLLLSLSLIGCGTNRTATPQTTFNQNLENLNATLWVQTSVEYKMACTQTYKWASEQMAKNLKDKSITAAIEQTHDYSQLPPAVIVDIDETILDNSPFEARLLKHNQTFNGELWAQWVNEEKALPVPGAKDFLESAKENGVKVFYVSNRKVEYEKTTVENLQKEIDPAITASDVLSKNEKPDWTSDKTSRRKYLSKKYRIILLVGDDYNDFTYLGKASVAQRNQLSGKQRDKWGKLWFILPGPTYGSYENALLDYDHSQSAKKQLHKKMAHLRTAE